MAVPPVLLGLLDTPNAPNRSGRDGRTATQISTRSRTTSSLWTDDCTFTLNGTTFSGKDAVRSVFLGSGSFKHHRISLVPSFKDQIRVHGDTAFLYFECHDIALDTNDPGGAQGAVVTHLTNFGMIRKVGDSWLYWQMHGGSAAPVSVDAIYDT